MKNFLTEGKHFFGLMLCALGFCASVGAEVLQGQKPSCAEMWARLFLSGFAGLMVGIYSVHLGWDTAYTLLGYGFAGYGGVRVIQYLESIWSKR